MITYSQKLDGIFEQYEKHFKFSMKLIQNGEKIEGEIRDYFGKSTFSGIFNGAEFKFLKSYYAGASAGAKFKYIGKFDLTDKKILGRWHSPNFPSNNGAFWLNI